MFDNPEQLIGLGAATLIIPILVAHLKPLLRALPPFHGEDAPWPFVADLVGVAWVIGLMEAGAAPGWIDNWITAILVGFALGVASGAVRDAREGIAAQSGARARRNTSGMYNEPQT